MPIGFTEKERNHGQGSGKAGDQKQAQAFNQGEAEKEKREEGQEGIVAAPLASRGSPRLAGLQDLAHSNQFIPEFSPAVDAVVVSPASVLGMKRLQALLHDDVRVYDLTAVWTKTNRYVRPSVIPIVTELFL